MHPDYPQWLTERYAAKTQTSQIHRVGRVEECYGNLDEHFANGTYQEVIESLQYSTDDERANRPNPSKIQFEGNIRTNLQSYKSAVVLYLQFLNNLPHDTPSNGETTSLAEESIQKFALERDMQVALRRNITCLDPTLTIIDDGAERAVNSGLIDITCEDENSVVVIELKAGKADSRAIGQILGYMGDLQDEEEGKPVRGILVAHDFDKRAKSAARVVPTLKLAKYAIEFTFTEET